MGMRLAAIALNSLSGDRNCCILSSPKAGIQTPLFWELSIFYFSTAGCIMGLQDMPSTILILSAGYVLSVYLALAIARRRAKRI